MSFQQVFLEICRSFRTTSEKLALENYVLAYQTADKDHVDILHTVFPIFFCVCFFVLYKSKL